MSGSIVRTACHFGAQNGAFVTRKNFLQKNHKHNFDLLARFIVRNSKRKSEWVQSYGTCHFGAKNGANTSRKVFFRKTINLFLMYLLNPFTVQNLKKILTADPDLWLHIPFGTKMVHLPWRIWGKTIDIIFMYLLALYSVEKFLKNP